MSPEKREVILDWYQKAEEDLLTSEIVIEANPLLYDISAFHSQQGAEKYLKSFLVFNEILPPRTHNLRELIDIAAGLDVTFETIRLAESLSKYAIRSRYPDDFEIDTKEQALEILKTAKIVKGFVKNKIGF